MEKIYVIEQLDFSIEECTTEQDVSISQIGYVKEKETAIRMCDELKSKIDERGMSYEVKGEEGTYPRFVIQEIKEL